MPINLREKGGRRKRAGEERVKGGEADPTLGHQSKRRTLSLA